MTAIGGYLDTALSEAWERIHGSGLTVRVHVAPNVMLAWPDAMHTYLLDGDGAPMQINPPEELLWGANSGFDLCWEIPPAEGGWWARRRTPARRTVYLTLWDGERPLRVVPAMGCVSRKGGRICLAGMVGARGIRVASVRGAFMEVN
jgi:hypothetical protein